MKFLRDLLDSKKKLFEKGGKLEKFYVIFEMYETILFTFGEVTKGRTYIRDGIDLKRTMFTVVIVLISCMLMAMWNSGYQVNVAIVSGNVEAVFYVVFFFEQLGLGYSSIASHILYGVLLFLPQPSP